MQQLHANQKDTLSIQATDIGGNPVKFVPDTPPVWLNSNPAAVAMTVSADGLSAVLVPVAGAVGEVTTVTLSVTIGGVTFTATDDLTVVEGAIAGVQIIDTFSDNTP